MPQGPQAAAARPPRVDLARRLQLNRELLRDGWVDFVRRNLPLARAGDVEAQVQIGRVLQTCKQWEKAAATQASDKSVGANSADFTGLFSRYCDGLQELPPDQLGTAKQWLQLAAGQGNGSALLQLATDADSGESPDQRLPDLHRALASADPLVIYVLVMSTAAKQGADAPADGPDMDVVAAEEALTECAAGYDCSASGPIYGALPCVRKGCLHADGVERYYELLLSPQKFAEAQAYSQQLAANLGSGGYDWPEAQTLEKQLLDSMNGGDADANQPNP